MNAVKGRTYPLGQLIGRQGPVRLNDPALAMSPLRFDGIQPRALDWQLADQDTHSLTCPFDPPIMILDPVTHSTADMPRRIVPDERQHPEAHAVQLGATVIGPKNWTTC